MQDDSHTLLLMKSPIVFRDLRKEMDQLPAELNIGPMSNRKNTKEATPTAFLLPDEAAAIKELAADNVHIYFRQLPSQKTIEWDDIKNNFS